MRKEYPSKAQNKELQHVARQQCGHQLPDRRIGENSESVWETLLSDTELIAFLVVMT